MARAKKVAPKKAAQSKKPTAKKEPVVRAPQGSEFVLLDGRKLADVKELADTFEELAEQIWAHHVNEHRNDFSQWVEDVFADAELAEKLRKAMNKHHAQVIIYRTILERA